jgi:hypothetical protein
VRVASAGSNIIVTSSVAKANRSRSHRPALIHMDSGAFGEAAHVGARRFWLWAALSALVWYSR